MIRLDVEGRTLHLEVSDEARAERRRGWTAPVNAMKGGYQSLYIAHVMQADKGADLDFLVGSRGHTVTRESH